MRWIIVLLPLAFGVAVLATSASTAGQDKPKAEDSYIKVEAKGKLQTGIMAIGGETTGVVLETKSGNLELDLGKSKELRAEAEKLKGKVVVIHGTLTLRKGVEVRQRTIVQVEKLKAADADK